MLLQHFFFFVIYHNLLVFPCFLFSSTAYVHILTHKPHSLLQMFKSLSLSLLVCLCVYKKMVKKKCASADMLCIFDALMECVAKERMEGDCLYVMIAVK